MPDSTIVLIVPAGRGAREQAERFGYYHCQNRRSFRPGGYIAFYEKGTIELCAEIDGTPEDDVIMSSRAELSALAEHTRQNNGSPDEPHSLYKLKNITMVGPIINDKTDHRGLNTAFVQKQTYCSIGKLRSAKLTSQLA